MNGAAPSEDTSQESFSRILGRLTHAPVQAAAGVGIGTEIDPEDVSLSISREAVAALDSSRKRAMAPVGPAPVRQAPVRPAPVRRARSAGAVRAREAEQISYEQALQAHGRKRVAQPLPGGRETADAAEKAQQLQASRMQAEANALSALRTAKRRLAGKRGEVADAAASAGPIGNGGGTTRGKVRTKSNSKVAGKQGSPAEVLPPVAGPQRRKAVAGSSAPAVGKPSKPSKSFRAGRDGAAGEAKKASVAAKKAVEASETGASLGLQVASHSSAIAQRQSSVSIRLSAVEAEQLRLRAAESGVSVSAYMRSCVLEAEHLRAQVKQALVELRASHTLAPPPIEPQPLFSAVYAPPETGSRIMRSGFAGFLSGAFALMLGRFHR